MTNWNTATDLKINEQLKRDGFEVTNLCVICDIDGTVANPIKRRHFVEKTPKDWEGFFDPKLVAKDAVIEPVALMVRALQRNHQILYVSGRRDTLRDTTILWLKKNNLWFYPQKLWMRKDGDFRPDTEVKIDLLAEIRAEGWEPFLALDDRKTVVDMWRQNGIMCAQVAEGDF